MEEKLKNVIMEVFDNYNMERAVFDLINDRIAKTVNELAPLIDYKVKSAIMNDTIDLDRMSSFNNLMGKVMDNNYQTLDENLCKMITRSFTDSNAEQYLKAMLRKSFDDKSWHCTNDLFYKKVQEMKQYFEDYLNKVSEYRVSELKGLLMEILEEKTEE